MNKDFRLRFIEKLLQDCSLLVQTIPKILNVKFSKGDDIIQDI